MVLVVEVTGFSVTNDIVSQKFRWDSMNWAGREWISQFPINADPHGWDNDPFTHTLKGQAQ